MALILFRIALVVYALILLLFLALTRREQQVNKVSNGGALAGFACCVVWPLTIVYLAYTARRYPDQH